MLTTAPPAHAHPRPPTRCSVVQLYENLLKDLEDRMNPFSLVRLIYSVIAQIADPHAAIALMGPIKEKVSPAAQQPSASHAAHTTPPTPRLRPPSPVSCVRIAREQENCIAVATRSSLSLSLALSPSLSHHRHATPPTCTRAAPRSRPRAIALRPQIKYDTTATISINTIVAQLNMQLGNLKEAKELLDECNAQVCN